MEEIFRIESVSQLNSMIGRGDTQHPLITIIDFSKIEKPPSSEFSKWTSDLYSIMLKERCQGSMKYGRQNYDFQDGTLVFLAPKQIVEMTEDPNSKPEHLGWGIFFHPDLIRGTSLSPKMKGYTFFSYESNEALHVSEKEQAMLSDIVEKIEHELSQNIDSHSQSLIVSNIELLLNYCVRYYDRQFITRTTSNKGILSKFENLLTEHFQSEELESLGLPTVQYCADMLNLSPNYLGDLLKKETGKNAQDHIHYYLIEEAKNRLLISTKTVSEVAFELGFEYPQYFSKMFKKKTGFTPGEYRNMN